MALFHGRDARLPLLTQIYQMDEEDHRQLFVLAVRFSGEPNENPYDPDDSDDLGGTEDIASAYWEVLEILPLIRAVMAASADDGLINAETLHSLSSEMLLVDAVSPFVVTGKRGNAIVLEPLARSNDSVRMRDVRFQVPAVDPLAIAALSAIRNALTELWQFSRCEECHNPFQVTQPNRNDGKQTYCSYRCSSRAGGRRRYKSRKGQSEKDRKKTSHATEE